MPSVIRTINIEPVGMSKDRRVPVRAAEHAIYRVVRGEMDASPLKRFRDMASGRLNGTQPTHRFFNDLGYQGIVASNSLQRIGVLEQGPQTIREQSLDCRYAAEKYNGEVALDLIVAEAKVHWSVDQV